MTITNKNLSINGVYDLGICLEYPALAYSVVSGENVRVFQNNLEICSGAITIPEQVDLDGKSYAVTEIGEYGFSNNLNIVAVTIPESVDIVEASAFYGCHGLESVIVEKGMQVLDSAFGDCSKLKYNIYDNAKYLGSKYSKYLILIEAVSRDIESCNIASTCRSIGEYAFIGCSSLTTITIPSQVYQIGRGAFANGGLTSARIYGEVNWSLVNIYSQTETLITSKTDTSVNAGYLKDTYYEYSWTRL